VLQHVSDHKGSNIRSLIKYLCSVFSELHTRTTVTICCHNTDYVHVNEHDRTITVILARYCIRLPDDGSFVIRNMLEYL